MSLATTDFHFDRFEKSVAAVAIALAVAALVSLGAVHDARAREMSGDDFNQHLIDSSNRTVQSLLEAFRPNVAPSKQSLLNKELINVVPLAGFNAYFIPKTKEIQIPLGIVYEIHLQALAYVYTVNHPTSGTRYNEWISYLAERSERVRQRFIKKESVVDDEPILNFWTYANLPALKQPLNNEDADTVEKLMLASIGLVLAHELGHLILNHKPYDEINLEKARAQEQEADDFGADLVRRTLGTTMPGLLTGYLRFAATEEMFHPFDPAKDNHPKASCRISRMLSIEVSRMFSSEEAKKDFFRNAGISDDVLRNSTDVELNCK